MLRASVLHSEVYGLVLNIGAGREGIQLPVNAPVQPVAAERLPVPA